MFSWTPCTLPSCAACSMCHGSYCFSQTIHWHNKECEEGHIPSIWTLIASSQNDVLTFLKLRFLCGFPMIEITCVH